MNDTSDARHLRTAYFAGLIDGEAHIGIHPRRRKNGNVQNVPVIAVKMTCEKTILALAEHFGGTVTKRRPGRTKWKPQFVWARKHRSAFLVIQEIHSFLITKRDDAAEILEVYRAFDEQVARNKEKRRRKNPSPLSAIV